MAIARNDVALQEASVSLQKAYDESADREEKEAKRLLEPLRSELGITKAQ
jgi:hypothetical protein